MVSKEKFEEIIRQDIDELEKEKEKLQKKIDKLTDKFSINDLDKLQKCVFELEKIKHTQTHFYSLLGSLNRRFEQN